MAAMVRAGRPSCNEKPAIGVRGQLHAPFHDGCATVAAAAVFPVRARVAAATRGTLAGARRT